MGDKVYKWYVTGAVDDEVFHSVHHTREEALAEGQSYFGTDPFVLIEADKAVVQPNFNADWVIDTILERLEENNVECWGEDGVDDGWGDVSALEANIQKAVADWLISNPPRTFCVDDWRTTESFNGAALVA